ncbi:trigger factor [Clostridium sp. TF06-15AC]|uniref:Trigger factor n=1 Tax=Clostridium segne TaxID=2763038 RepID=A0AAW3X456_9CLOT|nr:MULTISPECIES: trigger factor [Clostridium]MBC5656788.1 trigger factor [Clostridium segne]RHU71420.1 trigger factor [Clostridium sp. TF06-15AC]
MSLQVEKLEKNMAKLTIEVPAEEFDAAIKNAYNKNKNKFSIPGFRKGKAPLAMLEKMYGAGIFYEDAANEVIDASYPKAAEESKEEIVSTPEIKVTQIEKGKAFIYEATVALKPEVTLGEYKGVEVKKAEAVVTDEDVENELTAARKKNGRLIDVEDGAIEDGDNTIIDFTGYIDDKTFDGGAGTDYPLVIGSHSFIEGFEDQLIGKKKGETCDVNVTFPAEYHADELAGKPAKFVVTIKEVKRNELPELNDEFASEVSDFDTLDEYKADIRKKLQEKKEQDAKVENENNVIEKVVENAQMELPQPMVDTQAREMVENYARRLQSQGLNINDYMKYTGMTPEKLMEQMRPEAEKRIKTRLVLEKVVEVENVEVSDEKLDEQINEIAASYKLDGAKLKEMMGEREKEQIREDLKVQAAIDLLVEQAKLA